ncbi:hypothetical protein yrohd0001_35690 [Yersinia rohdei ATCC 43380]|nr:hypothetical protein yrohd0001_35690 [Yersinia rohdei ATCC 43380]
MERGACHIGHHRRSADKYSRPGWIGADNVDLSSNSAMVPAIPLVIIAVTS